ncbi:MAG: sigma-54 dependent transcriptional regulator [marine benthic group bacterium]|nr:sigma-54 dependent transcriptional regulator [Gemmatimonadota bacterium]
MTRILVVDDVPAMAEQYAYDLRRLGGWRTRVATGGREALEVLAEEAVDAVLLDLEMPGVDGFEVLETMVRRGDETPVVVYTGTGDFDRCVRAIRLGAYGFIDKADSMRRVVHEIESAVSRGRLEFEVRELRARVTEESPLVGSSPPMQELREAMARTAPIPNPVLVLGESGTGKELVARELHRLSGREDAPFVAVNSAALPETLVESELFGHEKGAFTGADRLRRGAFERASGGTLFLDEIGDLPPAAQAKLLRVLETGEITRVGGERPVEVEARVIAATHRDLDADVETGRFRKDLLFRINVHTLRVPPLRDRPGDVAELATHLLTGICARLGLRPKRLAPETSHVLAEYDWSRNNVRELRNVIERMVIAADGDTLEPAHVPKEIREAAGGVSADAGNGDADAPRDFRALRAEAERRIVREALARNEGHVTRTAEELGLADHASLLKIMRRLGLERD